MPPNFLGAILWPAALATKVPGHPRLKYPKAKGGHLAISTKNAALKEAHSQTSVTQRNVLPSDNLEN